MLKNLKEEEDKKTKKEGEEEEEGDYIKFVFNKGLLLVRSR